MLPTKGNTGKSVFLQRVTDYFVIGNILIIRIIINGPHLCRSSTVAREVGMMLGYSERLQLLLRGFLCFATFSALW